ncbi:gag-pol polyprotein [Penicillium longicatenatum]|uniref:gag-pol polyprotein n=1 Tax=Penicillium longicatenatum TaxID=1561947 RepID=UPI0025486B82|nr:gag-pol polyprotein [Penicillium longicatenatum]KAJ5660869.1 gag-pol polyprotein [Penicillium longicatenatum]
MKLNSVTIRDANMPPNADEFAEDFAGMQICSMVDLFSGYDQISLAEDCRDMTAIMTPMGLVRMVTILQGGANSVAQCQRVVQFVLADAYGKAVQAFLDDFGIKGPKTTYNDEMAFSGVRRYVLEHLQNLDETLYLLELAGIVISAEKSQFAMSGVAVVSWVCDKDGRRPDKVKVARLVFWPVPTSVPEVRSFMGLAVYFRVVVEKFGVIITPLYLLLKAGADFKWEDDQQLAFDEIKRILLTFPCVLPIDYDWLPLIIIVAIDASGKGSATDLPGALVTSWLAWIRLFDFEVKHVPRDRHGAADGLSRRPHTKEEVAEQETEEDVDEFILAEIGTLRVMLNPVAASIETPLGVDMEDMTQSQEPGDYTRVLSLEYSDESEQVARWLTTFRRPQDMPIRRYKKFKNHACDFMVQGEHLFYRGKGLNLPLRRVLDQVETQKRVIITAHDELGHKGRESTYHLLKLRYWWDGMYSQVSEQHAAPPSWRAFFYAALMADRMTTCATTGMTPYHFLYGKDAILPLEIEVPTWSTLPWETISSTEDLISLRARQILQKDQDVTEAIHRFERIRERNKTYFDSTKVIRLHPLEVGNLVLVHDTQMQDDMRALQKLRFRWHGPYRIREVVGNGSYRLEELNGTPIKHWFSAGEGLSHSAINGDRLKRFWLYRETGVRE